MAALKNKAQVVDAFDVAADSKRRVSLRGAKWKHYHVKAFSNGSFLLEPRVLVAPEDISKRTLRTLEKSIANFKKGQVSEPIDLTPLRE